MIAQRRAPVVLDRIAALVVTLLLAAAGAALLDWRYGWVYGSYPDALDLGPVVDLTTAAWWPWALGAAGLVLVLFGLWWLLLHLRSDRTSALRLPGSDASGTLTVDLDSVADAVAAQLARDVRVRSTSGTARTIAGHPTVVVRADADAATDQDDLIAAARRARADLAGAVDTDDIRLRVIVSSSRARLGRRSVAPRVR